MNLNFDNKMRDLLSQATENISVTNSEDMLKNIKASAKKENKVMKKNKPIKIFAITVAACFMLTVGVIGAGKVAYTSGWSSHNETIEHYPTQGELAKWIDFNPSYPQKLGEYECTEATPGHNSEKDENGNVIRQYTEMHFRYNVPQGSLTLNVQPLGGFDEDAEDYENISYGDTTLKYHAVQYKFVPPDYELTDEDKRLEESGDLMISYGSSEVEMEYCQSVIWVDNDMEYCLLSMETGIEKEKMLEMAKQVVDNKGNAE